MPSFKVAHVTEGEHRTLTMATTGPCYMLRSGNVTDADNVVHKRVYNCRRPASATDVVTCCAAGDDCLNDGLCRSPGSSNVGKTGIYIAGCSDPSHKSPACNQACKDQYLPDVTYNQTSNIWSCCGSDDNVNANCGNPTGGIFQADPLGVLLQSVNASVTASAPASTSSATTTSSAPAVSSAVSSDSATPASSGPNVGAIAGGVVGGVAALVQLVLAVLFLFRKRRRDRQERSSQGIENPSSGPSMGANKAEKDGKALPQPPAEASGKGRPLHASGGLHEMGKGQAEGPRPAAELPTRTPDQGR